MTKAQATFVESYLADHVHDMDSQEEVQAQAEEAMRLFKKFNTAHQTLLVDIGYGVYLEDLKKSYAQRWVEVVDLSFLMELGRQHKLKEVEGFDLQQVIEAIQDLEVDIDFKDSDMTCDHCEKEFGSNEETCLHEGDLYCVECFNNIDTD